MPRVHLVSEDAQGPPVAICIVRMRKVDDLRCHVLGCAGQGVGLGDHEPRKPHVTKFAVAALIQHHILRLQVPVHDTPVVQVLEGLDDTPRIESRGGAARLIVTKDLRLLRHQLIEAATQCCLQEHVEELVILVGSHQPNHEGAFHQHQHFPLPAHLSHSVVLLDVALGEALHGVPLVGDLIFHEVDVGKAAAAQQAHLLQPGHWDLLQRVHSVSAASKLGQLIFCRGEAVHIRKQRLSAIPKRSTADEALEQYADGLALKRQANQAVGARVDGHLRHGHVPAPQQRPLAEVARAAELGQHLRHFLAIGTGL
mmetsp:Transcript_62666/g.149537  ORF Transcript_62666/g.149537 Transcript_62666/m.149537 type:complete len:312 (+) Transcript_62666:498-1433(+)